ncbi:MAG TPA: long-chain fatty acid--CoA ligase [Campylobacterales bacterium]|nr:long-chain fatty acid--CoA ligase [Campylobacterales bacterium]
MTSIQESILTVPVSRVALIDTKTVYTYGDLLALKEKNQETIDLLTNTTVVINGRPRVEFALLLSLLDGHAKKILFLPQDIDKALHAQYYNEAKVNHEIYMDGAELKYTSANQENETEKEEISQTQWIIPTSGTTNIPKLVSHTFSSLTRTAKTNVELGEKYRWGLVFDIYRFSGIQVLLQSLLSGSTLIVTDPTHSMSEMLTQLADKQCNALSATPSFWRKVLMTKESNKLPFERITLGGEISDSNILKALKQKFSEAKIVHIYASTEVGVGFSVTDGEEGFPVSFLDGGLNDIQMKIDDENLLWIAPKEKNQKYLSKNDMYDNEGYINTGDLVEVKNDRVYFLGRDSGAINVGGNKVQPEEVERVLLQSGLLSAAYVYALKNAMMGSLVCANVVLSEQNSDKKEAKSLILKYCREQLEGFKVPAIIKFVETIETTQSGKLKRT